MVAPFRGANRTVYRLGSSGANNNTTQFTRYDFDGQTPVVDFVPDDQAAESFDWVDENTIIYTTYSPSANRKRLSLAQVIAEPFLVTADTRWNADGFIETRATSRIRKIRTWRSFHRLCLLRRCRAKRQPRVLRDRLGHRR